MLEGVGGKGEIRAPATEEEVGRARGTRAHGAVGVGVAVAAVTSSILADSNLVREKIVRTQFTPDPAQPTFASGWHIHPGVAIFQVQEGKVTILQNCQKFTLHRGDTYIEVPYLPVNATATAPAQWTTTYILANSSAGGPDRLPATEPSCPASDNDNNDRDH